MEQAKYKFDFFGRRNILRVSFTVLVRPNVIFNTMLSFDDYNNNNQALYALAYLFGK